jgi:hypothetical protein
VRCAVDALSEPSGQRLVETDLPRTAWLNAWRHGAGPMMSVQLVNYDADIEADHVRELGPFRLRVRAAAARELLTARYVRPDAEPVDLALTRRDGCVDVELPGLRVWGILVLAGPTELSARAAAAQARKWLERLRIARRVAPARGAEDLALVREAERLLSQIQGAAAAPDSGSLTAPLRDVAGRLRQRVEAITEAATAAAEGARREVLGADAVLRFDFGQAGAAEGWTEVRCDTQYAPERGYGWVGEARMTSVDHGAPDALHRDYIRNVDPATYLDYEARYVGNRQFKRARPPLHPALFRVDLPDGDYVVTVISGTHETPGRGSAAGEGRTAMTCVDANGVPTLTGERIEPGRFTNRAFRVRVAEGRLDLDFHGSSVGPFYHNTIEWLVNGVTVQRADQRPTTAAAASLALSERMANAALREWTVLGPFDDPDWTGMARRLGPERGDGRLAGRAWRQEPALGVAIVPVGDLLGCSGGNLAFGVAHVQCPRPRRAVLYFSTSQCGAAYVNGELVYVDNVAVGTMRGECRTEVDLRAGRNTIMIKTVSYWPGDWSIWAALTTPDGEPMVTR